MNGLKFDGTNRFGQLQTKVSGRRVFMDRAFIVFAAVVLFVGWCGFPESAMAAPGDLDPSYSFDGRVVDTLSGVSADQGAATAVQADGKILVAGTMTFGNDRHACGIVRYNADASLDASFDGDGKVYAQIGQSGQLFTCRAIAVQTDGKIIVAGGTSPTGNSDFGLIRFNQNGSLDTTFNNTGIVTTNFDANSYDYANALAVQPDGKIVAAGVSNTGGANFAVARYKANGSLDTSFNGTGKVSTDYAGTNEQVDAVAVQPDGKIVAAGSILNGSGNYDYDFALMRYNADGTLDAAFDGDGKLTTDFQDNRNDQAHAVLIQPDGKIVAVGSAAITEDSVTSNRFALARYNANGSFDTSFDVDGKVTTRITTNFLSGGGAQAAALQSDGRIVATGTSYIAGPDFTTVRYNPDGSLDTSLDGDGKVTIDFLTSGDYAYATAVQTDGKIVAVGYIQPLSGGDDFALARYHPNGSLDQTFGGDGRIITDMGFPTTSGGQAVAAQTDGKIVVAGYSYNGFNDDFAILRYNADGTRDFSFGTGGKVLTDISTYAQGERAKAIAIQTDGRIVAAGQTTLTAGSDFALVRYLPNGALDTSFGSGGVVATDFSGGSYDYANAVAIQADGKIVAAGVTSAGGSFDVAVIRYNADGTLDTTFDVDGKVVTSFSSSSDYGYAVVIQPDGRIVVAGSANLPTSFSDFILARYNADGSLDQSFDGDGKVSTDISGTNDGASALALQTDGKIVAAGGVLLGGQGNFALVRYNTDGSLDSSFDGDGKVTTNVLGGDNATSVAVQRNGRIVVAGSSYPGANNNEASLARYNADGSLDASFGTGGTRTFDMNGASNDFVYGMALDAADRIVVAGETGGSVTTARILSDVAARSTLFDFDGDGRSDISIFRPSVGQWWYLRSSDGGNRAFAFGTSSDKLVPGDYTGDGRSDIAVFRPSTGEWFVLRSENLSYYSFPFGASGDIPAPGDYDADGQTDAAVFRPSTGVWYIRRSTDGGTIIQQFGQAGDVPVVADYDGDHRSDIAIWRASNGQWWINRSTLGLISFEFGSASDRPVQGDYTGDDKADAAFFRPATNEWFILRSENQNSYYSFPFGTGGDVPAPGDYDGDGKTDATVFRPSTNTWYVQRTTAGTLIQSFGQAGDKPVPSVFVP